MTVLNIVNVFQWDQHNNMCVAQRAISCYAVDATKPRVFKVVRMLGLIEKVLSAAPNLKSGYSLPMKQLNAGRPMG